MKKPIVTTLLLLGAFSLFSQRAKFVSVNAQKMTGRAQTASIEELLNLEGGLTLEINNSPAGRKSPKEFEDYKLYYKNIPVEYSKIRIHYENGKRKFITGEYYPAIDINTIPLISEKEALLKAKEKIKAVKYSWEDSKQRQWFIEIGEEPLTKEPKGQLVICPDNSKAEISKCKLAYKFDIYGVEPVSRNYVYVDAQNGQVIDVNRLIYHADGPAQTRYSGTKTISTEFSNNKYRLRDIGRGNGVETYDLKRGTNYGNASDFVDIDNNWTAAEFNNLNKDNAALDAHWGAMMTYDYFYTIHGRNSFNDGGAKIKSYVHYGNNYVNAFWNSGVMTYGDGNAIVNALTSVDIVGHEFGHGVNLYSANLAYELESGALNEGFSDIWGACVEHFADPINSTANPWLQGDKVMLFGGAFRSMSNPNLYGQPDTYGGINWFNLSGCIPQCDNTQPGFNDCCGVHTNSGVLNHWFYLLSVGGNGTNDNSDAFNVLGINIESAQLIAYRALTTYLGQNSNFEQAREFTIQSAIDIFGECSQEVISTTNAWHAVGVGLKYTFEPQTLNIFPPSQQNNTMYGTIVEESDIINFGFAPWSAIVASGANVTMVATKAINIKQVHILPGAEYRAYIEPSVCSNARLSFASSGADTDETTYIDAALVQEEIDSQQPTINLFPNPANDYVTIDDKSTDFIEISIYDELGKLIRMISTQQRTIDISYLKTGYYVVKIDNENSVIFKKLIKR